MKDTSCSKSTTNKPHRMFSKVSNACVLYNIELVCLLCVFRGQVLHDGYHIHHEKAPEVCSTSGGRHISTVPTTYRQYEFHCLQWCRVASFLSIAILRNVLRESVCVREREREILNVSSFPLIQKSSLMCSALNWICGF